MIKLQSNVLLINIGTAVYTRLKNVSEWSVLMLVEVRALVKEKTALILKSCIYRMKVINKEGRNSVQSF